MTSLHQPSRRLFLRQSTLGLIAATNLLVLSCAETMQNQITSADCVNFDSAFARLLLEICRYTYSATFPDDSNEKQDADQAIAWINKAAKPTAISLLDDGKGNNSTSVACVVCYPDKNIVSYMGTKTEFNNAVNSRQSIEDWAKNAEFEPVAFIMTKKQLGLADSEEKVNLGGDTGLVHEGFFKELRAIQEKVIAVLNDNGGKTRDLYITGHSQGGAEAALATRAFSAGGFNVKATYTFAAPRSSNQAIADSIAKTIAIHRIEFGNDIVPHVPTTHAGHTSVLALIDFLQKLPTAKLTNDLTTFDAKHNLVGIGRLCYGNNESKLLRVDISADEEAKLFKQRLTDLRNHPEDWAEHHHLAGTKAELAGCKDKPDTESCKGNYTGLVSKFACQQG